MCGIVGGFWRDGSAIADRLSAALEQLRRRGPDDRGADLEQLPSGTLALGHARLSIIDLSSGGHQPMMSTDGSFAMVFNGEIYNYRELRQQLEALGVSFRTQSDSEVLLAAWIHWGPDCLRRLDGMFAFVIHDRRAKRLICARDAFGIKPLFFAAEDRQSFLFASTQRALVSLRGEAPRADWQRCYDYLVHSDYDSDDRTFVRGVRQLRPGHWLEVDLEDVRASAPVAWWRPSVAAGPTQRFEDAVDQVREAFLDKIRLQLRSDVAVGAALSGGVDSSAVVCAMRHVEPDRDINTFSYVASGTALNEEPWADLVNRHVGARAHKVSATEQDLLADLDDMVDAQEEPFASTSIYAQYRVFKLARDNDVTVTLDGQGADELLAGYTGYPGFRMASLIEAEGLLAAHRFARQWSRWPNRSYKLAMMELGRVLLPDGLYAQARAVLGRNFRPDWMDVGMLEAEGVSFREMRPPRGQAGRGRRVVEQLSKSLQERGLPALLRHADRNSMRFSVESRVPFLTNDMANLLLALPERYLISDTGETKHVFKAAMRGIVPDAILDRKDKIGFATPERDWLLALAPQLRVMLEGADAIPLLRREQLLQAFDAVVSGKAGFTWQLWRWVNFVRWFERAGMKA